MKSMKRKDRWICALAVTAAVLGLGGCDLRGDTEQAHLQRAKDFKTEGKLQSSAIELQNALQKNPESAEARWLLGEVYLDLGQAPEAEQERYNTVRYACPGPGAWFAAPGGRFCGLTAKQRGRRAAAPRPACPPGRPPRRR